MAQSGDERLDRALVEAVRSAAVGGAPWTVLYSGGLDSSLLAYLVPEPPGCTLTVVGLAGARDLEDARSGAALLRRELRVGTLETEDVRRVLSDPTWGVRERPEPWRSVRTATVLALQRCRGSRVLMGQGADELFFGYAHFGGTDPDMDRARAATDLQELVGREWPWTEQVARRLDVTLRAPFLDERVIEAARGLSPPDRRHGEPPKHRLRSAARRLGLPRELVERRKRAMQYGSGIARAVARER